MNGQKVQSSGKSVNFNRSRFNAIGGLHDNKLKYVFKKMTDHTPLSTKCIGRVSMRQYDAQQPKFALR